MSRLAELEDPEDPGVVIASQAIGKAQLDANLEELVGLPWQEAPRVVESSARRVEQRFQQFVVNVSRSNMLALTERIPHTMGTWQLIVGAAARLGLSKHIQWDPTEISVQRYLSANLGISSHKDSWQFVGLIGIAALEGEAELEVTHGGAVYVYPTGPGDIVFLRAPYLTDSSADLRPLHAVTNVQPPRTSLTARMPDPRGWLLPGMDHIGESLPRTNPPKKRRV